jgi:hypothetical protein
MGIALTGAYAQSDSPSMECRVIGNMSIVFKAGTSERQIQAVLNQVAPYAFEGEDFQLGARWSSTSFGGAGSTGNPIRLGYSLVPDGVFVPNSGLGSGSNSLFARMNALFGGNTALWQSKIAQVFQRWDDLSGVNYVLMPDDGAALHNSGGVQNVRGDVRISMITLTDPNVLAYNFFPNNGDMVMNRSFNWNQAANDYRFVRNTLGHEHGHGLGLEHVIPINNTKLMEPFLSVAFDGPQSDDIQGAQWYYGDWLENNDTNATKSDLGAVANGQLVDVLAVERPSDQDWFRIQIPAGNSLSITATPVGSTYQQGPQGGGTSVRDSLRINDLRLNAYQMDGTTLIQSVNANGLGLPETLTNIQRPASGEIALKVDVSSTANDIQRYKLTFALTQSSTFVVPDLYTLIRGTPFSGDLTSLLASDDIRLVIHPGVVFSQGQPTIVYEVEGDSPVLTPSNLKMYIEASMSTNNGFRTVDLYNFDTSAYEEVAAAAIGTTESVVSIDVPSNAGRFVAPDGTIRARLSHKTTGPAFSNPYKSSTDQIYWELTP